MINVIYPNFHYPCDRLAFFKAAYHMFDAEFYVKADDDIYLRPGKVRGYVLQFLKSIIWLLFILLRQIDLLLFLQKKDLSTGLTLVAWRKDQLSMIQIWNGQFKFWDMFLLNFIKIHIFTNEMIISNSGTYVALIHIQMLNMLLPNYISMGYWYHLGHELFDDPVQWSMACNFLSIFEVLLYSVYLVVGLEHQCISSPFQIIPLLLFLDGRASV